MRHLPPLDTHAHVDVGLSAGELRELGVIFVACRSIEESRKALDRSDELAVWGVGCHPAVAAAQAAFDGSDFKRLVDACPFVSEVGLDGRARVPMATQTRTFKEILGILRGAPRITSIHSYAATAEVLALLEGFSTAGVVLHWWLGTEAETARAIDVGCYFSVNQSSVRKPITKRIPLDRLLPETDHPYGDRAGGKQARPGEVSAVEKALSGMHGLTPAEVRSQLWRNLATLAAGVPGSTGLLPRSIRRFLIAA